MGMGYRSEADGLFSAQEITARKKEVDAKIAKEKYEEEQTESREFIEGTAKMMAKKQNRLGEDTLRVGAPEYEGTAQSLQVFSRPLAESRPEEFKDQPVTAMEMIQERANCENVIKDLADYASFKFREDSSIFYDDPDNPGEQKMGESRAMDYIWGEFKGVKIDAHKEGDKKFTIKIGDKEIEDAEEAKAIWEKLVTKVRRFQVARRKLMEIEKLDTDGLPHIIEDILS